MYKKLIFPLVLLIFVQAANAQTAGKIEAARQDPATKIRSEQADARLIDKKQIKPAADSIKPTSSTAGKKSRRCIKKSSQ